MHWRLLQMTRDGERQRFSTHKTNWKLPEVCFALLAFQRLWFKTSEVTILSQHSKTWLYYMLKYWLSVQHANIALTQSPSNSAIRLTRKFLCAITDDRGESVTGIASGRLYQCSQSYLHRCMLLFLGVSKTGSDNGTVWHLTH